MSGPNTGAPGDAVGAACQAQGEGQDGAHSAEQATIARKRFATLQAELARRGYELRAGAAGEFYIVRWGLIREARSIEDAEAFARTVGIEAPSYGEQSS